ncbi:MAG TPA: DinB family protein [Candidatus Binatia bacterium]|nr:DinB family protein [Candidatus Binatia bacterium]
MSIEIIIALWKDTRAGLIQEVDNIPEDQFSFRATPETRSIAELLQHIISAQKILIGETCRADTNFMRQSFAAHAQEYAGGVETVNDKNGLLELLRTSMDEAEACLSAYGDKLDETMTRLDGKPTSKEAFLTFALSHEGYHRGQLTVFERLLSIEPVLTGRTKKLFARPS